jgi:N-acetylneuraminic acid mutarotase
VNGKIYVMGGLNSGWSVRNTVYVFDPGTQGWSTGPSLNTAVAYPAATVLNGTIYLVGGDAGGTANPFGYIQKFTP